MFNSIKVYEIFWYRKWKRRRWGFEMFRFSDNLFDVLLNWKLLVSKNIVLESFQVLLNLQLASKNLRYKFNLNYLGLKLIQCKSYFFNNSFFFFWFRSFKVCLIFVSFIQKLTFNKLVILQQNNIFNFTKKVHKNFKIAFF